MKEFRRLLTALSLSALLSACSVFGDSVVPQQTVTPPPCTPEWNRFVSNALAKEQVTLPVPFGSPLWMQALENALPGGDPWPEQGQKEWCRLADRRIHDRLGSAALRSFRCEKSRADTTAGTVCRSPQLIDLDRRLEKTLDACRTESSESTRRTLTARQHSWIRQLNRCGTGDEAVPCLRDAYRRRIATLQAKFNLVAKNGPFFFRCPHNPDGDLTATVYATTPPTLVALRQDSEGVLFFVPSEKGERYEGDELVIHEEKGRAKVRWGFDAATIECVVETVATAK